MSARRNSGMSSALDTGMLVALALCVSASASVGFISLSMRKAPQGWEDSDGFHYGKQLAPVQRTSVRVAAFKPHVFPLNRRRADLAPIAYN